MEFVRQPDQVLKLAGTAATVANRMMEALTGHGLFASAPSWDGKCFSAVLRAASLPHHALRLRDTDETVRETVSEVFTRACSQRASTLKSTT